MDQALDIGSQLLALALIIYGLLLVAGAPFKKSPTWANQYASWLIALPFRIIWFALKKLFGKERRRQRRRQGAR